MATKIQIRRDAAADWTSTNPTLAAGEIGFESDTNKFKIGDGTTAWTSLNYAPEGYATTSYVDTQDANIASDTLTFTNKTFDANGTGNSISNIETADIAAGTLVTAAEGIGSNDNDTTLPTSAAVKAYADSVGGGTITALNNQAADRLTTIGSTTTELDGEANLTFDGSTLTLTGSAALDGVTITDNSISTNRSNDNLNIEANGTGQIQIRANGGDFANYSTSSHYTNGNLMYYEDLSDTIGDGVRHYTNQLVQNIKLTGSQSSSNSSDRWRNQSSINLDLNGSSSTATTSTYRSRGPMALEVFSTIDNSSATNSTLGNASGGNYGVRLRATGTGDYTITNTTGMGSYLDVSQDTNSDITITDHVGYESIGIDHYGSGTGNLTITDHWHFRAGAHGSYATGTLSLTNNYGFYFEADSTATNTYAFYDASNSLSRFGAVILANQAGDPSTVTDSAHIYAKDVSSSSEVFVRDEAGNVTQISPHNEAGEWQYWSENIKTGKKVRINMERMIRKLEEITGETFIENE
jgi:hypothetical protein